MNKQDHLDFFLECKDHTVSGEKFQLLHNREYDMLITSPKPGIDELSKYYESEDYISHTDSKRSFFEKLYHIVKEYALARKVKLISRLNKTPGTLLDIGAGTGDFLNVAKNNGWTVHGIEPNDQAKSLAISKGIELESEVTSLKTQKFDVITMWHVLEHVPDVKKQIKELKQLVASNGHVVIAVPNFKSYDAKYYHSFWAAYDTPRHLWHFSRTSIQKLFEEEKFQLANVIPMKFDSFYVSLLSEKYKRGKMNFFKAFCLGCYSNFKAMRTGEYSSHIYILKNT